MKKLLEKHKDIGILISRLGIGAAFLFVHGWGKIMQGPELWAKLGTSMSGLGITQIPVFWGFMASVAEFGGGLLLILGLFPRTAAAFLSFTMAVAIHHHLSHLDPWTKAIYPIEMISVLILFIFIGAGKYSLDYLLFKKK